MSERFLPSSMSFPDMDFTPDHGDFSHNDMYRRMAELQEKLKESEEERFKLEEKFKLLMCSFRQEEENRLRNLQDRYARFLEDCSQRNDRNERILRSLEKVESGANIVFAKTERLKLLRRHYEAYLERVMPHWKQPPALTNGAYKPTYPSSTIPNQPYKPAPYSSRLTNGPATSVDLYYKCPDAMGLRSQNLDAFARFPEDHLLPIDETERRVPFYERSVSSGDFEGGYERRETPRRSEEHWGELRRTVTPMDGRRERTHSSERPHRYEYEDRRRGEEYDLEGRRRREKKLSFYEDIGRDSSGSMDEVPELLPQMERMSMSEHRDMERMHMGSRREEERMRMGPQREEERVRMGPQREEERVRMGPQREEERVRMGPQREEERVRMGPHREHERLRKGPEREFERSLGPRQDPYYEEMMEKGNRDMEELGEKSYYRGSRESQEIECLPERSVFEETPGRTSLNLSDDEILDKPRMSASQEHRVGRFTPDITAKYERSPIQRIESRGSLGKQSLSDLDDKNNPVFDEQSGAIEDDDELNPVSPLTKKSMLEHQKSIDKLKAALSIEEPTEETSRHDLPYGSVENKRESLPYFENNADPEDRLPYLQREQSKEESLPYIQNLDEGSLPYMQNEDVREESLPYIQNEDIREESLPYIQNEDIRQESLPYIQNEDIRQESLPYIQNEDIRQESLPYIQNEENLQYYENPNQFDPNLVHQLNDGIVDNVQVEGNEKVGEETDVTESSSEVWRGQEPVYNPQTQGNWHPAPDVDAPSIVSEVDEIENEFTQLVQQEGQQPEYIIEEPYVEQGDVPPQGFYEENQQYETEPVDYNEETYPESYYEQPTPRAPANLSGNVILEEDEYENEPVEEQGFQNYPEGYVQEGYGVNPPLGDIPVDQHPEGYVEYNPELQYPEQPYDPNYEQPGYEQPPYEQQPYEQPPYEQPPYEQPPYEQQPYEQPPYEQPPYEEQPYEQPPYEQNVEYQEGEIPPEQVYAEGQEYPQGFVVSDDGTVQGDPNYVPEQEYVPVYEEGVGNEQEQTMYSENAYPQEEYTEQYQQQDFREYQEQPADTYEEYQPVEQPQQYQAEPNEQIEQVLPEGAELPEQPKPPLSNLLESDSESYRIEHAGATTGNEDSDFDFSLGKQ